MTFTYQSSKYANFEYDIFYVNVVYLTTIFMEKTTCLIVSLTEAFGDNNKSTG